MKFAKDSSGLGFTNKPKTQVWYAAIAVFPSLLHRYVASKNQKAFMADLKPVYKAATKLEAEMALDELESKWGKQYPIVFSSGDESGKT